MCLSVARWTTLLLFPADGFLATAALLILICRNWETTTTPKPLFPAFCCHFGGWCRCCVTDAWRGFDFAGLINTWNRSEQKTFPASFAPMGYILKWKRGTAYSHNFTDRWYKLPVENKITSKCYHSFCLNSKSSTESYGYEVMSSIFDGFGGIIVFVLLVLLFLTDWQSEKTASLLELNES